jgi:hypothetical protein
LPALPGDGAALPQIAAALTSSGNVVAQIGGVTQRDPPGAEFEAGQRETTAVLSRLAELLAKAKIGTTINSRDIILQIENDGKDAPQTGPRHPRRAGGPQHGRFRPDRPLGSELITERPESSPPSTPGQLPQEQPISY